MSEGHTRKPDSYIFDPIRQQKQIWCPGCYKPWSTRRWLCPCGQVWSSCPIHLNNIASSSRNAAPIRPKRTAPEPMTEQSADAQLAQLAHCPNVNHSRPSSAAASRDRIIFSLGPRLAAKFPRLHQTTDSMSHRDPNLPPHQSSAVGAPSIGGVRAEASPSLGFAQ